MADVVIDDVLARMVVRSRRRPGLSAVCEGLLESGLRVAAEPLLTGLAFGDALHLYAASTLVGLRRADGTTLIGPPLDLALGDGDEVIMISSGDDPARRTGPLIAEDSIAPDAVGEPPAPERTVIFGWNDRAPEIVRLLDACAPPGSALDVVADAAELDGLRLAVRVGPGDPGTLGSPGGRLDLGGYDHVIVLRREGEDERALVTLLHLREARARAGGRYTIVCEVGEGSDRRLAGLAPADDVIAVDELTAGIVADPRLAGVFAGLFGVIGLEPVGAHVRPGARTDFHTVVEAARRRGRIAVGYRIGALAARPPSYGVVLNPPKGDPLTFEPADALIVIGGGEREYVSGLRCW